jgi:virulence-associated protein VagC
VPETDSWETLIESTSRFSEDFMAERQQPPLQEREGLSE